MNTIDPNATGELPAAGTAAGFPALCDEWRLELARVTAEVGRLTGASEADFLAIGARLHDFFSRSCAIAELGHGVVGAVTGEEAERAGTALREFVRRTDEHLLHAERTATESAATFGEIIGLLEKAKEPLAGFNKIHKVLRMLGTATRIESARLGASAAGFETLASDVAVLSVQVITKSGDILCQVNELEELIRRTLVRVEAIETQQRDQVRLVLKETSDSLATITGINERCSTAAGTIAQASAEVSRNLSAVVTSMQFHDIVRQQLEHVQEALVPLGERLAGDEAMRELIVSAGDICELQAAQLRHSSGELATAVAAIGDNLRGVACQADRLAEDARCMAGMADTTGSSFFDSMELGMSKVTAFLEENAVESRNVAAAMEKVAATVGEIACFVKDIENIGEEIELIAINAQIKAARTGSDGAALGVLAEAIQRLSIDTLAQTGAVSATLRTVTGATERLGRGVDEESALLEREIGEMLEKVGTLLQSVRRVNQLLRQHLEEMVEMVRGLTAEIGETCCGMAVQEQAAAAISAAASALEAVMAASRRLAPARKATTGEFLSLAERYTMESERQVHEKVVGMEKKPLPGETAWVAAASELGDNVELF